MVDKTYNTKKYINKSEKKKDALFCFKIQYAKL